LADNGLAHAGQRDEAQRMVADPKAPNEEALIYAGPGDKEGTTAAIERMAARGPNAPASTCIRPNFRRCSPAIRVCLLCEKRSVCRSSHYARVTRAIGRPILAEDAKRARVIV
jgi:hypothetical protein